MTLLRETESTREVLDAPSTRWMIRTQVAELRVRPEEEGFFAYMPQLPGVVSHGDSLEQAFDHLEEALEGALEVYREAGEGIPWLQDGLVARKPREVVRHKVIRL